MSLEARYDAKKSEPQWQKFWEVNQLYKYETNSSKETYSIDTPPPTVSGKLQIGHVFSYTQTEIIARYQRMLGKNVMYPFGFDDNGLPTEILTEKEKGVKGSELAREKFVELCEEVSSKYRLQFKALWQSLGFSCDWHSAYSTISKSSQRISQRSFLDLLEKKLVEFKQMPTLWCCKCQTSFAQAEVKMAKIFLLPPLAQNYYLAALRCLFTQKMSNTNTSSAPRPSSHFLDRK
jgi:valyl-tRNA synthetase